MGVLIYQSPQGSALPQHPGFFDKDLGKITRTENTDEFSTALNVNTFDSIVLNFPDASILQKIKQSHQTKTILTTDLPLKHYASLFVAAKNPLIDYVLLQTQSPSFGNELKATLNKIKTGELGDISTYLPQTEIHSSKIEANSKHELCNAAEKAAAACGASTYKQRLVFAAAEEIISNVLKHAQGTHNPPDSANCHFNLAMEPPLLAISTQDSAGILTRETFFHYVSKLTLRDSKSLFDTKASGAGIGIFRVLYGCHSLICNVIPERHTEIIVLTNFEERLRDPKRSARSISYFESQPAL